MKQKSRDNLFILEQLIRRDFTKKYKRTALGFAWSILSPLLLLLIMNVVYTQVFNRAMDHYSIFLFSGYVQYQYFSSSTTGAMTAISNNASIFSKIDVEKIFFVISSNVSYLVTYLCTLLIYFFFVLFDGIKFSLKFFWLFIPVAYQIILTFACGLIVAVVYVYIRDLKYIYPLVMRITMYASAIFYPADIFPAKIQELFYLNPLYLGIDYMRSVVIHGVVPDVQTHLYLVLVLACISGLAMILYEKLKDNMYLYM